MKAQILLILSILSLISCDRSEKIISGSHFEKSFIHTYFIANDVRILFNSVDIMTFDLEFEGERVDKQSDKYKPLSEKFNDLSFNSYLVPFSNNVFANEFASISIISDKDFDNQHPAGTPLDNIVFFPDNRHIIL